MSKKSNLLVAASGTGGHIFPALAVSKELEDEWNIHWLGVNQRLDANFIPQKYNLTTLNIKTPRKNIFLFYQYIQILMSTFQIIRILKEKDNKNSLVEKTNLKEARDFIDKKIVTEGMIPKTECCIRALAQGVKAAHIIDGRIEHSLLLEIFTNSGIGTMIVA